MPHKVRTDIKFSGTELIFIFYSPLQPYKFFI